MRFSFTIVACLSCMAPTETPLVTMADDLVTALACDGTAPGAIPDDGIDDRAAIQAALTACAGRVVDGEVAEGKVVLKPAGVYDVFTPPPPRPLAMLVLPPNTALEGMGDSTSIRFSGDNGRRDWRGIQVPSGSSVEKLRLVTAFVAGSTVEQSHVVSIVGPVSDIRVSHISCDHPQNGSKSGDCIQLVCYPPTTGQPDKRCWNVEVDHSRFERSGRSGIAFHSGLHGDVDPTTGHLTSRFHHNVFGCILDQAIDGEGTGDTTGVEVDHNVFEFCSTHESALAVQIQSSSKVWFHDNVSIGRGMEVLGCDGCRFADNHVVQAMPGDGSFPVRLRNVSSNVVFSDEVYERAAAAGPGAVLSISAKDAAPRDVTIRDSHLSQRSPGALISATGIQGLAIRDTVLEYTGPSRQADGITILGSGGAGCPSGIRADRTELADVVVTGPLRAVLMTSGSYCGAGSFDLQRTSSAGTLQGLRCENVASGSRVTGPVVYADNTMPTAACAGLVP